MVQRILAILLVTYIAAGQNTDKVQYTVTGNSVSATVILTYIIPEPVEYKKVKGCKNRDVYVTY